MEVSLRYKKHSLPLYSLLASIGMCIVILSLVAYRAAESNSEIIGEAFVDTEFPPPSNFPFYLKPMTWLMIFIILGWLSFIELIKNRIRLLGANWKFVFTVFLFLIISLTFYEILYNFMLWGSILSKQDAGIANPDTAINEFPTDKYQVNLVFATKVGVTIFVCALYALLIVREKSPVL